MFCVAQPGWHGAIEPLSAARRAVDAVHRSRARGDLAGDGVLVAPKRLGAAYGLINVLQSLGLAMCLGAGWLNDMSRAGPHHPAGYAPMLWLFGLRATPGFAATAAL